MASAASRSVNMMIPTELDDYVQGLVRAGEFGTLDEAFIYVLRQDRARREAREELKHEVGVGLEQVAGGRCVPLSKEDILAFARQRMSERP